MTWAYSGAPGSVQDRGVSTSFPPYPHSSPPDYLPTIAERINQLANNPHPVGTKKLSGEKGTYRIRTGDYRILYSINDKDRIITVLDVDIRGQIYRKR